MADMQSDKSASLSGGLAKSTVGARQFDSVLATVLDKSNKIAKLLGGIFPGSSGSGGGNSLTTNGTFSSSTPGLPSGGWNPTYGGLFSTIGKIGAAAIGGVSAFAQAMPTVQDTLHVQLLNSQARFSGMQGNVGAQVRSAMQQGTVNSQFDAIQAISQGTAAGLMPALPGYSAVLSGTAQISNLTGSMGSAMQATTALNQGATVNRMRQFGINVRNAQGTMRDPADIFKEVFNFAQQNAGKKLTAKDVAVGMQPGNGLANFMDYVSGGDSTLRGALQTAAVQFSQGGNLSRDSLLKTGQITSSTTTQSDLFASKYGIDTAAGPAVSRGFDEANRLLIKATDNLSNLITTSSKTAETLTQIAKIETLAGDNLGKAAASLATIVVTLLGGSAVAGALASKIGKIPIFASKAAAVTAPEITTAANVGKAVIDPITGAASHIAPKTYSFDTAASTLGKSGALSKLLGPVGILSMAKDLFNDPLGHKANAETQAWNKAHPDATIGDKIRAGLKGSIKQAFGITLGDSVADNQKTPGGASGDSSAGVHAMPALTPLTPAPANASALATGTTAPASNAGAVGSSVIAAANAQIGIPYSWAGGNLQGPTLGAGRGRNTVGFDCSSFTRFVMAKSGVILPRTAHEQQKCGTQISPKDAQPGDLLFWGNPAHHVGIYVGGGMMIESPQTGGKVQRVGVNLASVTSCSRVLSGSTGTSDSGNLLSPNKATNNSQATGETSSFDSKGPSSGVNLFANNASVGFSPEAAMSGGASSSSGLGFGSSTSGFTSNTNLMAQKYLTFNPTTEPQQDSLFTSGVVSKANLMAQKYLTFNPTTEPQQEAAASSGTTSINYGGVTIHVDTKGANVSAKDIGKAVKEELTKIGINAKVANK